MGLDLSEYQKIQRNLFISFFLCIAGLIVIQINCIENLLRIQFGEMGLLVLNQFFYGALGGTIAGGLFLKQDKEINEVEYLKKKPDPKILRLPDTIDNGFYIWRILTSGIFAVLGAFLIIAGFSYLEVNFESGFTLKQYVFFIITSILIGLYQFKFLNRVEKLLGNIFKDNKDDE